MTVDRGGLEYPISVEDQFSAGLKKFQDETRNSREEWRKLREELSRTAAVQRSLNQRRTGPSEAVKQAREERALANERRKSERDVEQARQRSERDAERARQKRRRDQQEEERLNTRQAGIERQRIAEQEKARAQAAKMERDRLKEQERAEKDNARRQQQIDRQREAANQRAIRQQRAAATEQRRAAEQQAAAAQRAQALEDRRAASTARRQSAERRAAIQTQSAQERLEAQQQAAARRTADAAERQAQQKVRSDQRLLEQQLTGAERINREQERTTAVRDAANRRARADAVRQADLEDRTQTRKRDAVTRTADLEARTAANRRRETQLEELRNIRLAEAKRRQAAAQARITKETKASSSAAGQLLFTFRRLVGILAVFTAARLLARGLANAVREAISFNAELQQATLGIQALLSATGQLVTATGRNVEGAEAFAAANAEARRQVALLRVEGLKTAATFDQLLFAFQSALGPGIQAGLTPDEIRGFAVRIAQAAAAVGVPQNQLAEEVRSILAGTITQRTTRIAAVLGIGNDDIKRAKEAGELADFLLEKFEAFQFAGEASLQNFSVIIANLQDATSQLLGAGGQSFFNELQSGLQGILSTLITTSENGTIINPEAIRLVRAFFDILSQVRNSLVEIFESFTLDGAATTAEAISSALQDVVNIAAGFAQGFVEAFTEALEIIEEIGVFAAEVAEVLGFEGTGFVDALREGARFWGQIVGFAIAFQGVLLLIRSPIFLIAAAAKGLLGTWKLLAPAFRVVSFLAGIVATKVGLIVLAVLAIVGAIALVVAAFKSDFIRSIEIGGLKIGTIADTIKLVFVTGFKRAAQLFEIAWAKSIAAVRILFIRVANFFLDKILGIVEAVLNIASFFSDAAEEAQANIAAQRKSINGIADALAADEKRRRDARLAAIKEEEDALRRAALARAAEIAAAESRDDGISPAEAAKIALERAKAALGFQTEQNKKLEEQKNLADDAVEAFSKIPPVIGQSNARLEDQAKILERLNQNIERSADGLVFARSAQELEGAERRLLQERVKAIGEVRKATRAFDVRIASAEKALEGIAVREARITIELQKQEKLGQERIDTLVEEGAKLADLTSQREVFGRAILALGRQRELAERAGNEEAVKGFEERIRIASEEATRLDELIKKREDAIRAEITASGLSQDEGNKVIKQISDLIQLQAQRILQQKSIESATRETGRAEDLVLEATENRLQRILILERQRLAISNARSQAELTGFLLEQRAINATRGVGGELGGTQATSQREIAAQQAQLAGLRAQTQELQAQFAIRERFLRQQIEETDNVELRQELTERITLLQDQLNTQLAITKTESEAIVAELSRLQFILDQPITAGLQAGLEDFVVKAGDSFEQVRAIAQNAIDGLASTISQTIGDALDPTKDLDLVGRFRTFFQEITNQILQLLVRLLIVKAIVSALGLDNSTSDRVAAEVAASKAIVAAAAAAAAAAQAEAAAARAAALSIGGGIGAADGGLIGSKLPGRAGAAFANAQGLAAGGPPRPKGLHPSDRIPIWAALGEFMQPVRAVQTYGLRFMEAIRQRKLDPNLARTMVGSRRASSVRTHVARRGAGYVDGGTIAGGTGGGSGVDASVNIINVFDRQQLLQTLAETEGQEVLVNVIRARSDDLRPAT